MGGCSAINCSNQASKGNRMARFPSDPVRRKRWVINCGRDKWIPGPNSRICCSHFEESQFEQSRADKWRKLRPDAVPTLFDIPNRPNTISCQCKTGIGKPKPGSVLEAQNVQELQNEGNSPVEVSAADEPIVESITLQEDSANYMFHKRMGVKLRVKEDIVPRIFHCQPEWECNEESEKYLLWQLIEEHPEMMEDTNSGEPDIEARQKKAWGSITRAFNEASGEERTTNYLKKIWESIKIMKNGENDEEMQMTLCNISEIYSDSAVIASPIIYTEQNMLENSMGNGEDCASSENDVDHSISNGSLNNFSDSSAETDKEKLKKAKRAVSRCFVPMCTNTSVSTPEKLFISVPNGGKRRDAWMEAAGRENLKPLSDNCNMYCCEDHFNLKEDMENYIQYKLMGKCQIKMKDHVVPHIFHCQKGKEKSPIIRRQRERLQKQLIGKKITVDIQESIGNEEICSNPEGDNSNQSHSKYICTRSRARTPLRTKKLKRLSPVKINEEKIKSEDLKTEHKLKKEMFQVEMDHKKNMMAMEMSHRNALHMLEMSMKEDEWNMKKEAFAAEERRREEKHQLEMALLNCQRTNLFSIQHETSDEYIEHKVDVSSPQKERTT